MAYQYPFAGADEPTKRAVWNKGRTVQGYDPNTYRMDVCGYWMAYAAHGDTASQYGWEIDHIKPRALGGPTVLENLQPLYWKVNRLKGDNFPWKCP